MDVKTPMDARCPRQLESLPEEWCPLAVQRLKSLRNAGRELSEEEEARAPGCPWCVNHQLANYCFFKYIEDFASDNLSDVEVAHLNCLSVETVKKVEKTAINKTGNDPALKEIRKMYAGDQVMEDFDRGADYDLPDV